MTDATLRKINQAFGNARLLHDVAAEDKERNRQQNKFTCRGRKDTRQHRHNRIERTTRAVNQHAEDAGDAKQIAIGVPTKRKTAKLKKITGPIILRRPPRL